MSRLNAQQQKSQCHRISPIYRPRLTSVLSIANRMGGMSTSTSAIEWYAGSLLPAAEPDAYFLCHDHFFPSRLAQVGLLIFIFAFFLHLCGGIRHLIWDAGHG